MLILASASPRRKELLALITQEFRVVVSEVDEASSITDAKELVRELAFIKANDVFQNHRKDTVIGADTVVEVEGKIFGKPKDKDDARRMMNILKGKSHQVHTGICILQGTQVLQEVCTTKVFFDDISQEELERYLQTEQVLDKAGAYAIQQGGAKFVTKIEGCFFNVVGLPVHTVYKLLKKL
ncbi:MAG: Maf family protein [Christensenellaceae bacterium]